MGTITVDHKPFHIKGGRWSGLEGRQTAYINDAIGYDVVPMELHIGNMFWSKTGRTYDSTIQEFKEMGLNLIRLPIAPQALDPNASAGRPPYLRNAPEVIIENARLALETVIKKLDQAGIYVLLDINSCSNNVSWRAGRLDARPPYIDSEWEHYDYMKENCSCSAKENPSYVTNIQPYNEAKWLEDLRTLAGLGADLGVSNIMGINIFNEPWDYSWDEWRSMIDKAYEAINSVNSDILIFAQGVGASAGNQDGSPETITKQPHGAEETTPSWGENLYEAGINPPSMPKNRLVFAPHTFGPSVFVKKMFIDPAQPRCEGLEGDNAGDYRCNIVINPALLYEAWDEHFGYLKTMGYAVVIGAFGGNPDWPHNAEIRVQNRWTHITDNTVDWQWQKTLVNYLDSRGITNRIYYSINPEELNTGGLYRHAYAPQLYNHHWGWGTWYTPDQRKLDLLDLRSITIKSRGDVNFDGTVNILDALMIAQYCVRIYPEDFHGGNADVNCDKEITILDALVVARYSVGLEDNLNCW